MSPNPGEGKLVKVLRVPHKRGKNVQVPNIIEPKNIRNFLKLKRTRNVQPPKEMQLGMCKFH